MTKVEALAGIEARATNLTRNWNIWCEAVEVAVIHAGAEAEWIHEAAQRGRLLRAFSSGEPVWMVVDEMIQRWDGVLRSRREGADGFAHLRRAARCR